MSGFARIRVNDELVREAKTGDSSAHEALYRLFSPAVYTLALRIVGQPAKAEDVLQDTFIEVIRSIGRFRNEASLATWIRHVAVSKSLMLLRSAWERKSEALDFDASASDTGGRRVDEAVDLESALDALDPVSRTVVWLHDVEGYTHSEIGELTGQTASFSKSRLARAHHRLRTVLAPPAEPIVERTVVRPC